MKEKSFVVTHAHARAPLTITGNTLKEALEKEGLHPTIWRSVKPATETQEVANGEDN